MKLRRQPKLLSIIVGCGDEKGIVFIVALALVAILALVGTVAIVTTDIKKLVAITKTAYKLFMQQRLFITEL